MMTLHIINVGILPLYKWGSELLKDCPQPLGSKRQGLEWVLAASFQNTRYCNQNKALAFTQRGITKIILLVLINLRFLPYFST